jgi:hypothetical protein
MVSTERAAALRKKCLILGEVPCLGALQQPGAVLARNCLRLVPTHLPRRNAAGLTQASHPDNRRADADAKLRRLAHARRCPNHLKPDSERCDPMGDSPGRRAARHVAVSPYSVEVGIRAVTPAMACGFETVPARGSPANFDR